MMGIEITGGASEFSHERNADELLHLVLDPFCEYHDLFAQAGRACRLAMRMRQHGNILPFFCQQLQLCVEIKDGWEIFIFDAVFP